MSAVYRNSDKVSKFVDRIWGMMYILVVAAREGRRSEPGVVNKCGRIIKGFAVEPKWFTESMHLLPLNERILRADDVDFIVASLPYMANVWYKRNMLYPDVVYRNLLLKLDRIDKWVNGIPECLREAPRVDLYRVKFKAVDKRSGHTMCDINELFQTKDEAWAMREKLYNKYPRSRYIIRQ